MSGLFLRIRSWWETADRTQKVVTIFGSTFLALFLFGTFYFASRPKMSLVYGGLSPADQGRVVTEIQKLGIPVDQDLAGNVSVPSDKVSFVRSTLAASGAAPVSGHSGEADLGKLNLMSSTSVEQAQLNAIRQGEVASQIEMINGVSAAKVLISGGERSAFASEDNPPSASVTITEQPGVDLSGSPAKAIASMVAKSIPGLSVKNVTIVNQDGISLFDGSEVDGTGATYSNKIQAQEREARRIKRELQPLLDRFGAGATVMTVHVEMDFDKKHERKVDVQAGTNPIQKVSASETMKGSGSSAGGPAGASGNIGAPGVPGPPSENDKSYTNKQENVVFPHTETVTETERAPGTITKLLISVLVDEEKVPDPDLVRSVVQGYLPSDKLQSGEYGVTVTAAKFDPSANKALEAAVAASGGRERTQQMLSLLPIVALILVAVIILKGVSKVAKSQNVLVHALPGGQSFVAAALPPSAGPDDEYAEAEGQDPTAAAIAMLEQAPRPKKKKKVQQDWEEDDDDEPMHVRIGRINEKVNVPLEQLKKMARERPEAVAMLLKSWLIEETRR